MRDTMLMMESQGTPKQNYLYRCVKNGKTRNLDWWSKMFDKGYVISSAYEYLDESAHEYSEETKEREKALLLATMSDMMEKLTLHYGTNWDVHFDVMYEAEKEIKWNDEREEEVVTHHLYKGLTPVFVIRFPELTLNNSEGATHTIKDLFYMFKLRARPEGESGEIVCYYPSSPSGSRGQMSTLERVNQYYHSHLGVKDCDTWTDAFKVSLFCTGDNELNDLQAQLSAEYEAPLFELYLLTVNTFVGWESLEGKPYQYIRNLTFGGDESLGTNLGRDYMESLMTMGTMKDLRIEADFTYMVDRFKVVMNEKFKTWLKNYIIHSGHKSSYLVKKNPPGHDYAYTLFLKTSGNLTQKECDLRMRVKRKGDGRKENRPYTYFRGSRFHFRLTSMKVVENDPMDYEVHPKMIIYIKKLIENQVYERQVKRSAIISAIKGTYAKKDIA